MLVPKKQVAIKTKKHNKNRKEHHGSTPPSGSGRFTAFQGGTGFAVLLFPRQISNKKKHVAAPGYRDAPAAREDRKTDQGNGFHHP
jgi:hypothetical protein